MKFLNFFILMVLMFGLINADSFTKVNPQNIESISVEITRSGTIVSEMGMFSNMDLTLTIPQTTYYQVVEMYGHENGEVKKVGESEILNFKKSEKISSFTYSYIAHVTTNKRIIDKLTDYQGGMESFIDESEHIQINDIIKNKAKEITNYTENDLEKVALLAIWVNENMEYDLKEVGKNSNSIEVYEKRKGVCVEYTNLFLAMVRSLGIPGRAVTGYVYSPDYGWQLHSWGEVYLDKWIGVDPTWLEVASIDATHIPLYFNHDTVLKESITATVTSQNPLKWVGKSTLGSSTDGIEIKSLKEENINYKIENLPQGKIQIGDEGVLLFEIDVDHYMIFQANVIPCNYETPLIKMDKEKITYFLSPGKNFVPIGYKVSEMVNSNNKYFCPITISHTLGYDVIDVNIEGRKRSSSFDVYVSKISEGENSFKVYSNDGTPINILTNKESNEINIDKNTISEEIYFQKEGINKKNVLFYTESQVKLFDLDNMGMGSKEIIPTRITFNEKIPNDVISYLEIDFEFKNGDEITINYFIEGILVSTDKIKDRNYKFRKELNTKKIGVQNIEVKAKSYSEEFVYKNSYEVFEPIISCDIIDIGNDEYQIDINGPVKKYVIYINEQKINSNIITLEKGTNEIKIVWEDLAGYERTYVQNYNTEGIFTIIYVLIGLVVIFIIYFFRDNIMSWFKCKLK